MTILARWRGLDGMAYEVEDLGRRFRLTALGNVVRRFDDPLGDAGRAEWLTLSDRERTDWAELLLGLEPGRPYK